MTVCVVSQQADCSMHEYGYVVLQTYLPNVKVHAYFAPVTPPPSVGGGRRRFCRCCAIVWYTPTESFLASCVDAVIVVKMRFLSACRYCAADWKRVWAGEFHCDVLRDISICTVGYSCAAFVELIPLLWCVLSSLSSIFCYVLQITLLLVTQSKRFSAFYGDHCSTVFDFLHYPLLHSILATAFILKLKKTEHSQSVIFKSFICLGVFLATFTGDLKSQKIIILSLPLLNIVYRYNKSMYLWIPYWKVCGVFKFSQSLETADGSYSGSQLLILLCGLFGNEVFLMYSTLLLAAFVASVINWELITVSSLLLDKDLVLSPFVLGQCRLFWHCVVFYRVVWMVFNTSFLCYDSGEDNDAVGLCVGPVICRVGHFLVRWCRRLLLYLVCFFVI